MLLLNKFIRILYLYLGCLCATSCLPSHRLGGVRVVFCKGDSGFDERGVKAIVCGLVRDSVHMRRPSVRRFPFLNFVIRSTLQSGCDEMRANLVVGFGVHN